MNSLSNAPFQTLVAPRTPSVLQQEEWGASSGLTMFPFFGIFPQQEPTGHNLNCPVVAEDSFSEDNVSTLKDETDSEGFVLPESTFNVLANVLDDLKADKREEVSLGKETGQEDEEASTMIAPNDSIGKEEVTPTKRHLLISFAEFKAINMEIPSLVIVVSCEADDVSVLYEDPDWEDEYCLPQSTIDVLECVFGGEEGFDESDSECD